VFDGFNPYREWLGLGTSSPNYYELLGLPLHESDAAKTAAAADRAITRVRSFRPGPQAREWASLLDEIRAAKECLLDVDCRVRYEAEQVRAAEADPILPPESPPELEILTPNSVHAANSSSDRIPALPSYPAIATTPPHPIPKLPDGIAVPVGTPAAAPVWQAGPSPIYDFTGNAAPALESVPATIAVPTPLSTMPQSMPDQRILPAAYGTPQRATFRAAANQPQKAMRSRGRGIAWGAIILLWLVVAGLTYRLSIVARQQKLADDAAAEAEAKNASEEPRRTPSPHAQTESNTAAPTEERG
jgi:hypothetical protein